MKINSTIILTAILFSCGAPEKSNSPKTTTEKKSQKLSYSELKSAKQQIQFNRTKDTTEPPYIWDTAIDLNYDGHKDFIFGYGLAHPSFVMDEFAIFDFWFYDTVKKTFTIQNKNMLGLSLGLQDSIISEEAFDRNLYRKDFFIWNSALKAWKYKARITASYNESGTGMVYVVQEYNKSRNDTFTKGTTHFPADVDWHLFSKNIQKMNAQLKHRIRIRGKMN